MGRIVKNVSLCRALIRRKLHLKLQKLGPSDVTRSISYGVGAILLNFLKLSTIDGEFRLFTEKPFSLS